MKRTTYLLIVSMLLVKACTPSNEKIDTISELITSPAGTKSTLPHLTVGADEGLYMSWIEEKDSGWVEMKYARMEQGNWSEEELIDSGNDWFVNWADYPMMSVDEQGNILAHYLQKSAPETFAYDIVVKFKSNNGEWTEPQILHHDGTETEHGFVSMITLAGGGFQLAWLDGRNTGGGDGHAHHGVMTIRTAQIDINGKVLESVELDGKTCDCCQTGGVLTRSGPVFVYRDRSDLEIRDIYVTRYSDNEWTKPASVYSDNWNIAGCPVNGPGIDAIDDVLVVAWFSAPENNPEVKLAFSQNAGASFANPILIDQSNPIGRVDVVMLSESRVMVCWLDTEENKTLIRAQVINEDGSMGQVINVAETSDSRGSGFPQMAKVGNVVYFAWTEIAEERTQILMSKLLI